MGNDQMVLGSTPGQVAVKFHYTDRWLPEDS